MDPELTRGDTAERRADRDVAEWAGLALLTGLCDAVAVHGLVCKNDDGVPFAPSAGREAS